MLMDSKSIFTTFSAQRHLHSWYRFAILISSCANVPCQLFLGKSVICSCYERYFVIQCNLFYFLYFILREKISFGIITNIDIVRYLFTSNACKTYEKVDGLIRNNMLDWVIPLDFLMDMTFISKMLTNKCYLSNAIVGSVRG